MRDWPRRLGVLLLLVSTVLVGPPARTAHADEGWFGGEIVNKYSVRCLDVHPDPNGPVSPVQQFHCNGTNAQRWVVSQIPGQPDGTYQIQTGSHFCLARNPSDRAGQWYCDPNAPEQQWRLLGPASYGWYEVQNVRSGGCLDSEFGTADNGWIFVHDCSSLDPQGVGGWNQQWQFQFQFGQYG